MTNDAITIQFEASPYEVILKEVNKDGYGCRANYFIHANLTTKELEVYGIQPNKQQRYYNTCDPLQIDFTKITNDLFNLGNQIESLGIMVYDETNDNKIDLIKFGFNKKEFNLYNKIMSDIKGKLIWRNKINIVEPSNSTKKFIQPVNIWHGGDTCYEAAICESRNHKKGKIQWQAEFDTKNELQNFQNSFKTKFMEWYYKFIVIPSDCKLHMSMFVMDDYIKPWTDKRFCEFFNITGYIDDDNAEPNSEWETILNTMKEYV